MTPTEPIELNRLERNRDLNAQECAEFLADHQTALRHGTASKAVEVAEWYQYRAGHLARALGDLWELTAELTGWDYKNGSLDPHEDKVLDALDNSRHLVRSKLADALRAYVGRPVEEETVTETFIHDSESPSELCEIPDCQEHPRWVPELAAIRARAAAVTKGSWHTGDIERTAIVTGDPAGYVLVRLDGKMPQADIDFIANAKQDIPFLLNIIDEIKGYRPVEEVE